MLEIFDANATGFNSTAWNLACQASTMCTSGVLFGNLCATVMIGIVTFLFGIIIRKIRESAQLKQTEVTKQYVENQYRENQLQPKPSKYFRLQKRCHYKLHFMITMWLTDIVWILLVFLGQFGQNLHTNTHAQLYAYGYIASASFAHVTHVSSQFGARRVKRAAQAMRKMEQVDKRNEHDVDTIRQETRKYLMISMSIPIFLHVLWIAFAGLNDNLDPINFTRMLPVLVSLPQAIMGLSQLFHFTSLLVSLHTMPSFSQAQGQAKTRAMKRVRKRIKVIASSLLISVIGMSVLLPVSATVDGWLLFNLTYMLVMGIITRFYNLKLLTARKRRVHASSNTSVATPNVHSITNSSVTNSCVNNYAVTTVDFAPRKLLR